MGMRPLSPIEIAERKALFRRYESLSILAAVAFVICVIPAAIAPDYQAKVLFGILAAVFMVVWYILIRIGRRYRIK